MNRILLLLFAIFSLSSAFSQVTIAQQDFDGGTPVWNYSINPASYNVSSDYWAIRTTNNAPAGSDANFWALRDLDNGNGGGSFDHTLTLDYVDVSAYTSVEISFRYYTIGYDGTDYLQYQVAYDGAGFGTAVNLNKNTAAWTTVTITVPGGTDSLQLRMIGFQNGGSDYAGWDDFEIEGIAATTPTINVTPATLTGLDYVFGAGPSVGQSYSLSGTNLSPAAGLITITAPASFSVSTTLGGTYAPAFTLPYTGGSLAATDVFVRLGAGLSVGTYGPLNVTNAGGGATTENVAVSGTVSAACATPTNQATALVFSSVTASSIDVAFTAASPVVDNYLVVRHTAASLSASPVDATTYAVSSSLGGGTVVFNGSGTSFTDAGLSASTTYYYFVFAYNDVACSGGPAYLTPALTDNETTIAGPCQSDDFNSGYGNWSGGSGTYQNTTAGVTGNGTGFNTNNDDIITATALSNPSSITFTARASGSTSNFSIRIQYSTSASGPWTDASVIVANGSNTGDITNVSSPFNLSLGLSGNYFLRIVQSPRSGGSFYLDDVDVFCGPAGPEIEIQGNSIEIVVGDITPDLGDDTDFGSTAVSGGTVPKTFTIYNTGSADLTVTSVSSSNATIFAVSGISTPITVTPSSSTTFTVTFDPAVIGTSTATITVNSDDADEAVYDFLIEGEGTGIPDIVLASANPAVAASNIVEGSDDNVIYAYSLAVTTYQAVFTDFDFTTTGTAVNSNITNFQAWYSADNVFNAGADTQLDLINTSLGAGTHTFTGFSQTINSGSTGYIFITADLPCPATNGNTITVSPITTADLTFTNGNKTGTAFASGAHTIVNDTPVNVTGLIASSCENGEATISWTAATGCFDNYLVVASLSSLTTAPSGDGIAYTPNTVYGSGSTYDDGYVVYEASGTSVTVTGLTNGTNYTYTVFTRNDTTWSSGVEVDCTPIAIYCNAGPTSNLDSEIESVVLNGENNNINNVTTDVCTGGSGGVVNDYTTQSADLGQGSGYTLTVEFGDCSNGTQYDGAGGVWIDWNNDGDFDDLNEEIGTADVAVSSGNVFEPFTINVDPLQTLGFYRMRIVQEEGGDALTIAPCGTFSYGSVEDYSIEVISLCTPTHTVSTIVPNNGPVGTTITITGTGFTDTTTANFGGVSAEVTYNGATSLTVVVPNGAVTGAINIVEDGCPIQTSTFTILGGPGGTCGGGGLFTDLIISEVYDADANNVWYVELYNPTATAIDLAAGDYEIDRYASLVAGTPARTVDLVGTVPAYGVFVLNLGTSAATCTYPWDFTESGGGINEEDRNVLTKGGVDLDAVSFPNQTGYSILRLGTATGPTATYNAADWDLYLIESCGDLGVAPIIPEDSPEVTDTLEKIEACELDFSVTIAEGDSSTLDDITYKWFYNDGTNNTWTEVTSTTPPNLTIAGEDTFNLMISNGVSSVSTISGFQFYCEITEDTTCTNTSNAAIFEFKPEPYFRTLGTGLSQGSWDDVSLWEMSTDLITWNSACVYPTASNSDTIIIQALDSIAVVEGIGTPDVTADQLYVAPTGILLIEESAELNIEDGTLGTDILVEGILIDQASNGAGNGISFLNGSTWELGANGTVIKTYSSSVNVYRDNYETGIANIPATAHWAYVNIGQGLVAVSSIDMFYPNLYFESVPGNYDASAFNEIFKGQLGFTTVKGDLSIGLGTISAGTGTYKVYNNNFNAQEMLVLGDVYIGPGSEFTNNSYNGGSSTSHDNGTGLESRGSFLIDGIFDMTSGTGNTLLSGIVKQDVLSASGTGTFTTYDFELNNSAHAEIDDINIEVNNILTFTAGKIITDVASPDIVFVTNSNTAAIVNGATSGSDRYIEGKLQWTTDISSSYTFPVGENTYGAQGFIIDPLTGTNGSEILAYLENNNTLLVEDFAYCDLESHPGGGTVNAGNGNAGTDGVLDQVAFNLESPLQWDVTNPGGGVNTYDITVLANGLQDITPVTTANGVDVRYLMKNGEPGNTGYPTTQGAPSFNTTGFDACSNQYKLGGMSSFSKFTLNGANQANTTLPVELLFFKANHIGGSNVLCTWSTATEINNDFFTVERSVDGENFVEIGKLAGAGNSTYKMDYQFIDEEALLGISYYRLKQTDFDGTYSNSNIEVININSLNTDNVLVYPLPFENELIVTTTSDEKLSLSLYDVSGKLILSEEMIHSTNLDLSKLSSGTYFLRLNSNTVNSYQKVIKK